MQTIKLWNVTNDKPYSVEKAGLNLESRLEKRIQEDISIISNSLIVIGTQVQTGYGKIIDILAMNQNGELVIIELKRNQTYREVVAQGLDYATWLKDLDYDAINTILSKNNPDVAELSEYFSDKFNLELEEFNTDYKILIVGSDIDDSTRRIIEYLSSQPYNVNINALSFNYFQDDGQEYLAQSFVLPESKIMEESINKTSRRSQSIMKSLLEANKLAIGQELIFEPAQSNSSENPGQYTAKIVNEGVKCLKRANDSEYYSLSGLRQKIAKELKLADVRANWGFGARYEWTTKEGKSLHELSLEDKT